MRTVWVLGDQLNRRLGALASATPETHRVLLVESQAKLTSKRWHRQRLHVVLTSMRRFAAELAAEGFQVDHRKAPSLAAGLRDHVDEHDPDGVDVMEPLSWDGARLLERLGCTIVRSDQMLCHHEEFAAWASGRRRMVMDDFYRWNRRRLGYLMDGDGPAGGRWSFDAENREPPPKGGPGLFDWPAPVRSRLDDVDHEVLAELDALPTWGADPDGTWPTSRRAALARLRHTVEHLLPVFGPHQDAMVRSSWHLNHSLLSSAINLGLLHPAEVCDAAEVAYRSGAVPIASAEGFVRQIVGWREYVWGTFWLWMPEYRDVNELGAQRPLPPAFRGEAPTEMACLSAVLEGVHQHGYAHHIERLMVLGNLCLLAGVRPQELVEWMWAGFVDGAEWVMLPNVLGMALHADGGRMATKPYAAGGAYIDRMSDHCGGCRYDRTARVGADACPFTTLYWDFLARHRVRLRRNPRIGRQVGGLDRLGDLPAVRRRADEVLHLLDEGRL